MLRHCSPALWLMAPPGSHLCAFFNNRPSFHPLFSDIDSHHKEGVSRLPKGSTGEQGESADDEVVGKLAVTVATCSASPEQNLSAMLHAS